MILTTIPVTLLTGYLIYPPLHSDTLEDDERRYLLSTCLCRQYHCDSSLLVACGLDWDRLGPYVFDSCLGQHVEPNWRLVHGRNIIKLIAMVPPELINVDYK